MRNKVLIISLLLFSGISFGQSAKETFTKVNNTFKNLDKISYNINYSYFLNTNDTKPYETMFGVFKKVNGSYYSKVSTREIIVNDNYQVVVDNASKHLLVADKPKQSTEEQFVVDLDTALSLCSKITSATQNGITTYKMFFDKKLGYSQINVSVNTKTSLIKGLGIYLVNQDGTTPKLTITITNYNTNPVLPANYFSEKKYVRIDEKGNVSLNKKYNSFILLNDKVSNQ
ncbi:MAG: LolA family protein [bacterium]